MEFKHNVRIVKQHQFVTPQMAEEMLKHREGNRSINRSHVEYFIEQLKNGKFREMNTVTFGKSGRLMDGQHRLQAIALSDIPAHMTIVYGQDDNDFADMNEQRPLSISDYANIHSKDLKDITHHSNMFSAASLIMHLKDNGKPTGKRVPKKNLLEFINSHKSIFEMMSKHNVATMSKSYLFSFGTTYAMEYLIYEMEDDANKPKVYEFFDELWRGNIDEKRTPIQKAYANWLAGQIHTGTEGTIAMIAGLYSAWTAYKKGKRNSRLRIDKSAVPNFIEAN